MLKVKSQWSKVNSFTMTMWNCYICSDSELSLKNLKFTFYMIKSRRNFDKEFKRMAVELCDSGKSVKAVSEELGLRPDLLSRWRREFLQSSETSFSGKGNIGLTADQKEIQRLQKALKDAQLESEILKKAVSIFSRSDGKYSDL